MNPTTTKASKTLHRKHKIERDKPYYKKGITQYYTETNDWTTRTLILKRDHWTLNRKNKIEQHEPWYKQGIIQYYTENIRLSNTNPTSNKGSQNTTQKTWNWTTRSFPQTRHILRENIRLSSTNPNTNKGSQHTTQKT
jgi:hypothetical protein